VGSASAVNGLVRLRRTRNANSMAACSIQACPDRLLGSDVDRPQLTEVLRFVRAGDMVTVHSRAGGHRRTTGLVPVRHTTASTPASTVPRIRGCRRSRLVRRTRRCCVSW